MSMSADVSSILIEPRVEAAPAVQALACVIDYGPQRAVALPIHAGVELVSAPLVRRIPQAPVWCRGLMPWQGRQLLVLDLQAHEFGCAASEPPAHVLVVVYRDPDTAATAYGALCAPALVRLVAVRDEQQADLTEDMQRWRPWAVSAFSLDGQVIPVLEAAWLFSKKPWLLPQTTGAR